MERRDHPSTPHLFPSAVGIVLLGVGGVGLPFRAQWVAAAQHNGGERWTQISLYNLHVLGFATPHVSQGQIVDH